jgi:hypothetical protein
LSPNKFTVFKFEVGDKVRISRIKGIFEKGYVPNWSEEIFVVHDKKARQPPVYEVKDQLGEVLEGVFYEQELQYVDIVDDVYVVEKIVSTRKKKGETRYLVKWRGYPDKFNSWVTDIIKL